MTVIINPPTLYSQTKRLTYGPIVAGTTGALGAHTLFTMPAGGVVLVRALTVYTSVLLTSTGAATIALGVTGATTLFSAAFAYTQCTAGAHIGPIGGASLPSFSPFFGGNCINASIVMTIAGQTVSGGTLIFDVLYDQVTDGTLLT